MHWCLGQSLCNLETLLRYEGELAGINRILLPHAVFFKRPRNGHFCLVVFILE